MLLCGNERHTCNSVSGLDIPPTIFEVCQYSMTKDYITTLISLNTKQKRRNWYYTLWYTLLDISVIILCASVVSLHIFFLAKLRC